MQTLDVIHCALNQAVADEVFPGAVLLVRKRGQLVFHAAVGTGGQGPSAFPVTLETVYDLASLTKVLATTTAVLWLVQQNRWQLEDTVQSIIRECEGTAVGEATVAHLLSHRSGLPAWKPYYTRIAEMDREQPGFLGSSGAKNVVLQLIREELLRTPVGTHTEYSDIGFMLLGFMVERTTGQSLSEVCSELFPFFDAAPLQFVSGGRIWGMREDQKKWPVAAPTEQDPWRGRLLQGEVHDENAYALGGVAGHAGLFGTARAVLAIAGGWKEAVLGKSNWFDSDLARQFVTRQHERESTWALGWDTPSSPSSSGRFFSPHSFGHLGFTGTSLWVDPTNNLEAVLLSNRVYFGRSNEKIKRFRPLIHDLIYREFNG